MQIQIVVHVQAAVTQSQARHMAAICLIVVIVSFLRLCHSCHTCHILLLLLPLASLPLLRLRGIIFGKIRKLPLAPHRLARLTRSMLPGTDTIAGIELVESRVVAADAAHAVSDAAHAGAVAANGREAANVEQVQDMRRHRIHKVR